MKEIDLQSKGEYKNILKQLRDSKGKESKAYVLKSYPEGYITGYDSTDNLFIKLHGGPTITVGEYLKEADMVVRAIDFIPSYGTVITFK